MKWNREACYEEAIKYNEYRLFIRNSRGAYYAAWRNGWLKDYTWLKKYADKVYEENCDCVYAYIFNDAKTIYVGRSIEIERRDKEHRRQKSDCVYRFAKKNNIPIPDIIILKQGLTIDEGVMMEDFYVNSYRNDGWNVLNKAKTGKGSGSIGSLGGGRWTKKACYEEAKKYKTRTDFANNARTAYDKARKKDWIDDYTWFESNEWDYNELYEEAKKYNSKVDFKKYNKGGYKTAWRNGWLKDYTWFNKPTPITKRVFKFSIEDKLISSYESALIASQKNNCYRENIVSCCVGKRKTNIGYKWVYEDGMNEILINRMNKNIALKKCS